jgi:hypothetical protein
MRLVYREQLARLLKEVSQHAWLVTHRPFWALNEKGQGITKTEAIGDPIPDQLDMVLSGHKHTFESYNFESLPGHEKGPAQLVVGVGGDRLDKLPHELTDAEAGQKLLTIDNMQVKNPFGRDRYGYFLLDRIEGGWDGTLHGVDDAVLARCQLRGRDIECK